MCALCCRPFWWFSCSQVRLFTSWYANIYITHICFQYATTKIPSPAQQISFRQQLHIFFNRARNTIVILSGSPPIIFLIYIWQRDYIAYLHCPQLFFQYSVAFSSLYVRDDPAYIDAAAMMEVQQQYSYLGFS